MFTDVFKGMQESLFPTTGWHKNNAWILNYYNNVYFDLYHGFNSFIFLNNIGKMASFFEHTHWKSFFYAHFYLDGSINKQNCCYWAADNPKELHQKPLYSTKVTMWYGVSKEGIVRYYFLEEGGAQGY